MESKPLGINDRQCPVLECQQVMSFNKYEYHLMGHNRRKLVEALIVLTT